MQKKLYEKLYLHNIESWEIENWEVDAFPSMSPLSMSPLFFRPNFVHFFYFERQSIGVFWIGRENYPA